MSAAVPMPAHANPHPTASSALTERTVLMIVPKFPPVGNIGSFRSLKFANFLPESGWRPVVLTVSNSSTVDPSMMKHVPPELLIERVPIPGQSQSQGDGEESAASSTPLTAGPHSTSRSLVAVLRQTPPYRWARNAWHLATRSPDRHIGWNKPAESAASRLIAQYRPDVIFTSGPPHSVHLLGRRLKLEHGIPWIADFRDPWARRPWGAKSENPWGQRLEPWLERRCITAADGVILNTPGMKDEFVQHYADLSAQKFVTIPNSCDPDLAVQIEAILSRTPPPPPGQPLRCCHPGSLYRARDPRPLLLAIKQLQTEGHNILFEQIGAYEPEFQLERFVVEHGLSDCVRIRSAIPHAQILQEMAASDVLVLLQPNTPIQVPGKIFEMILFGKPILALCDAGNTQDLVQQYGLGPVADPRSPERIAAAIRTLIHTPVRHNSSNLETGSSALRRTFDARQLTVVLAELFDKATGRKRNADAASS